ncbi:phosphotransferase, partial [Nanoarchaeota archaeon]
GFFGKEKEGLLKLVKELKENCGSLTEGVVHGDMHLQNIMFVDGEAVLSDFDRVRKHFALFDAARMMASFSCVGRVETKNIEIFWSEFQKYLQEKDSKWGYHVLVLAVLEDFINLINSEPKSGLIGKKEEIIKQLLKRKNILATHRLGGEPPYGLDYRFHC